MHHVHVLLASIYLSVLDLPQNNFRTLLILFYFYHSTFHFHHS